MPPLPFQWKAQSLIPPSNQQAGFQRLPIRKQSPRLSIPIPRIGRIGRIGACISSSRQLGQPSSKNWPSQARLRADWCGASLPCLVGGETRFLSALTSLRPSFFVTAPVASLCFVWRFCCQSVFCYLCRTCLACLGFSHGDSLSMLFCSSGISWSLGCCLVFLLFLCFCWLCLFGPFVQYPW